MGIAIRRLDGPYKGQVIVERDDIAENLIDVGSAELATFGEYSVSAAPPIETAEAPAAKAIGSMTRAEREEECLRRGVSVTSGSGSQGAILKSDLIAALK